MNHQETCTVELEPNPFGSRCILAAGHQGELHFVATRCTHRRFVRGGTHVYKCQLNQGHSDDHRFAFDSDVHQAVNARSGIRRAKTDEEKREELGKVRRLMSHGRAIA